MATYNTRQQPAANTTYGQDDIFVSCSGDWGGAIYVSWKTKLTLNGSTFSSNTANQGGGALGIARTNLVSNDVLYVDNKSKGRGGAININYSSQITGGTFARNSAVTTGGAIYQSKDGYSTLTIKSVEFSGNISGGDGGAIYQVDAGSNTDITGSSFVGNSSGGNGGALFVSANASLTNVTFDGNIAVNGGALYALDTATVTVSDTSFLKKSDTIFNAGTINFSGAVSLAGDVTSTGTLNVADGTEINLLLADRTVTDGVILDYDALTFAGSYSLSVSVDKFQESGSYKLVANAENIASITVSSFADTSKSIVVTERDTEYVLGNQKFTLTDDADGNLCLTVQSPEQVFYAKTFDSNGNVITSYTSAEISVPFDTTNAKRVEIYEGAILNGSSERAYLGSNSIDCTVTGATFSDNVLTGFGGAVGGSNLRFSATDTLFIGNKVNGGGNNGGAIWYNVNSNNPGKVDLTGGSFVNNSANQGSGGAVFVNCGGYNLQVANGTWSGVEFSNNSAAYGGAVFIGNGQAPNYPLADIVIDNAKFFNNRATGTGGAIKNNSQITVTNSVFRGNSAGTNGGAINNYGTITITDCSFETKTDTIFNDTKTMNWGGKISLAGDVTSTGTLNVADGTEINLLLADRSTTDGVILDYDALTFAGSCSWSITASDLHEGSYKLVGNGENIVSITISVAADNSVIITERNKEYEIGNKKYSLVDDTDGNLCINIKSPLYAKTFDSNGNVITSYTSAEIAVPFDTTNAKRVEIYEGAILSGSNSQAYSGNNSVTCTVTGATFSDNIRSGAGGAVGGSNLLFSATDTLFVGNKATGSSGRGGAISYNVNDNNPGRVDLTGGSFVSNTAQSWGGAIHVNCGGYSLQVAGGTWSGVEFSNNSAAYGGAIGVEGGQSPNYPLSNIVIDNAKFFGNHATGSGGAIKNNSKLTISNSVFRGNYASNNGGAINNFGTITITDCSFETKTDTIFNDTKTMNWGGKISLAGDVTSTGTLNVADGTEINLLLADRTVTDGVILDYDALTFAGACSWSVVVDALAAGNYKLVGNGENITSVTVSCVTDLTTSVTITERNTEYVLGEQKFTLTDDANGDLCLNVKSPLYAKTFDSNGNVITSYTSAEIAVPFDTTNAKRVEIYEGAILDGSDSRAYSGGNTISCIATGATFSNNISSSAGAAVGGSNLQFTANNVLFTGNSSTSNNGGAIWYNVNSTSVGKVTVSESTFRNNYAGVYGGAIYTIGTYAATQSDLTITDSEFSGNSSVYGGGAVFGENSYAGITVKNSDFSGNSSSSGGAIESWGILSVTGGEFSNNSATGNGGAIYNKNIATLDGVNFNGNSAVNGGAIYNVGTCTVTDATFATATDTIYNSGMIEFSGTITLNASLAGNGSWTIAEGTVFALGYGIDLNNVDFSNATLTVDGLGLEAGAVIATGVTGTIGADDTVVNGKEGLSLAIMNGDLILKQDAELAGTQFVGSNCNYITGGEISGTLYSTTTYSSAVHTTLSNGTVGQYLLGGLWKKGAVGNAVEKAAVTIAGGLVKGSVYAGGYSAGANGSTVVPAEALMNVTVSSLDLSGGKVNGDIYGGIHACKYGYGKVGSVNLSVSGGIHNNVMGGGWAEQIAVSTVDSVNITVSGGEVDMLFAGGGASLKNSANISTVGTANITISGGTVKNIFLSGLNENCDIIGDVTLNISSDNSFDLITGLDYNGLDSTTGTGTVAIRTTAVACGEMNNIDTLVIGENCTLTLDSVENIGKVVFDDVVGEFNWTALDISGLSDVFANVDFEFNGSSYDTLADFIASGNASVDEENKRLILTGTLA